MIRLLNVQGLIKLLIKIRTIISLYYLETIKKPALWRKDRAGETLLSRDTPCYLISRKLLQSRQTTHWKTVWKTWKNTVTATCCQREGTYLGSAIRGLLQVQCYSIFLLRSWMQDQKMHFKNVWMTEAVRYCYHRGGQDHKSKQILT